MTLEVRIDTEFIRLDQFMKLADLAQGGGEAKMLVQGEEVKVNGVVETRRGRKLRPGDIVETGGRSARVIQG
ncbi:RNA-binding S4 domain-containing protein [bacterium]|nr:MAG: RNA-binding S4 domain-containing protein [bacterium]